MSGFWWSLIVFSEKKQNKVSEPTTRFSNVKEKAAHF